MSSPSWVSRGELAEFDDFHEQGPKPPPGPPPGHIQEARDKKSLEELMNERVDGSVPHDDDDDGSVPHDDIFANVLWKTFLARCNQLNPAVDKLTCIVCEKKIGYPLEDWRGTKWRNPFRLWQHLESCQKTAGHPSTATMQRWDSEFNQEGSSGSSSSSRPRLPSPWQLEREEERLAEEDACKEAEARPLAKRKIGKKKAA